MENFVPTFEGYRRGNSEELGQRVSDAEEKLEGYVPEFPFTDYVVDSDVKQDSGRGDPGMYVWIEFLGVEPAVVKDVADNYGKYHDHFKRWCDENGLYADQVLTAEDGVTFQVIVM